MKLPLHLIELRPTFQCRYNGINPDTVQEYVEAIEKGDKFPPIDVYKISEDSYVLVDGWHRFKAYSVCLLTDIEVNVTEGTEEEAQDYALFKANRKNGQRLTRKDQQKLVEAAVLNPRFVDMPTRQLAIIIGCSHQTIKRTRDRIRPDVPVRTQFKANLSQIEIDDSLRRKIREKKLATGFNAIEKWLNIISELNEFADPHQISRLNRTLKHFTEESDQWPADNTTTHDI